jgi:hypothetical protein
MKKITALFTLITFAGGQMAPVMAHLGGPYSGNTYDGYMGGVFQGNMTMQGGFGLFRFASGLEAALSPQAQSAIILNGITHYGECFGMVDYSSRTVNGITNSQSNLVNNTTNLGSPNNFSNGLQSYVVNTSWQAKITSMRPTVLFRGKGEAYFLNELYEDVRTATSSTIFDAVDIPQGGAVSQDSSQVISDTGLAVMERKKMRVTGTRITPIAYNANYAAAPNGDARN